MKITDLRVDGLPSGAIFVPSRQPALGWKMESDRAGAAQRSYRIEAKNAHGLLLWDSGVVASDRSAGILWGGKPLASRERVTWRVTVCDDQGKRATAKAAFEAPLYEVKDWSAKWIWFDGNNPTAAAPCPYFRKEFTAAPVTRARLYVGCRGLVTPFLNGRQVGCDRMAPGWTDFHKRIQYLSYDVTGMLLEGRNTLGAMVGDGWYCSTFTGRRRNHYGPHPELLMQLELFFADGRVQRVVTGQGWRCATGPILYSDIYDGEFYDSRLEMPGWNENGFRDSKWRKAVVGDAVTERPALVPKLCVPVRATEEIPAVKLLHPTPDVWIWDLGQNIAGVVRIENILNAQVLYTIRYGEMLNDDGTLYNLNYRSARSTDYFVPNAKGPKSQTYETRFTFHGFRYVQIDGPQFAWEADPKKLKVTGVVLHSDLEKISDFDCGHAKLNRLWQNVSWGQRDNFLEVPTDCPQRDERLGWTGDAEVFCGTAALIRNVGPFFRKYLTDMRDCQRADGAVPSVVPDLLKYSFGAAAWADAAVICPWTIYMAYGDLRILEENFTMMRKWVDYVEKTSQDLIRPETSYGDWLALSKVTTPSQLIGTSYFARTAQLTANAARELGRRSSAAHYEKLAAAVRAVYMKRFVGADGIVTPTTQTALALALHFELLPQELRERNAAKLTELVHANGDRLDTGFVGTSCLNLALSENGKCETAHKLYMQEEYPSWLFSVNQGATTMWERWNSYTKKDGFGNVCMNSFNHYAYGAVHEWVLRHLAGIDLVAPGGRVVRFVAEPDAKIGHVDAYVDTPYGRMSSSWSFKGKQVVWRVSAPANTKMSVVIPAGWSTDSPAGELPCGNYEFTLKKSK